MLLLVLALGCSAAAGLRVAARGPSPGQKNITEAFSESGTDKMWLHGYQRWYEEALAPYKDVEHLAILEIGAKEGKSLKSWVEYFSKPSRVDGVAYMADPVKAKAKACEAGQLLCNVVNIYSVDQSNPQQLENFAKEVEEKDPQHPGWDVIIDDGSHVPMHQLTTFKHLFPKLRPGGLYIVEDMETSYAAGPAKIYGYEFSAGIDAPPGVSAMNKFMELVHVVNRKHFVSPGLTVFGQEVDSTVSDVRFADNVILIKKQPAVSASEYPNPKWLWLNDDKEFDGPQVWKATSDAVRSFEARVANELTIP